MNELEFARFTSGSTEDSERIIELLETLHEEFDGNLSEEKITALISIQKSLWDTQDELRSALNAETISPERYLSELNFVLKQSMKDSQSLLGNDDFERLFGEAGHTPDDLIDRDTFLKEQKKTP